MARLFIGTSGWHYASWRGPFFPREVPQKQHLAFYAGRFNATELNGVFYRTPSRASVRNWAAATPRSFRFAWKASKYITHWKRLKNARSSLTLMETRLQELGPKLGPVLFQLPPQMRADAGRLEAFLGHLRKRPREYVFEFRHPSWYADDIFALLRRHRAALCISDHADAPAPWEVTARHVYVRGHGPGGRYKGHYSDDELRRWARRIRAWRRERRSVYVFFDNDQKSAAPKDALRLKAMLEGARG